MTTIQGTIRDSGSQTVTGKLRITLDGAISDSTTTPDTTYVPIAYTATITSGALSVSVPETATSNTTALFELFTETTQHNYFFLNGEAYLGPTHLHTDSKYYTGDTHTDDSVELIRSPELIETIIDSFHAIVPNQSTVEWSELVPTGLTTDVLDTGLRRLAEILTSNTDYVEALRGGPRFLGAYDSGTSYQLNDSVSYAGSSWLWINADPGSGQTPAEGVYWQKISAKGDPGGTGGDDTAYDATGWNGDTNAPSKNAVRDIIETLAPIANAALTGNPTAPTQLTTDNSTRLATTAFAQALLTAALIDTILSGNPTTTTQSADNDSTRLATTAFVKATHRYSKITNTLATTVGGGAGVNGINIRDLNTIDINSGDVISLSANTFTLRPGTYQVEARAVSYASRRSRLFLWNDTDSARTINGLCVFTETGTIIANADSFLSGQFTISGGNKDFQLRHFLEVGTNANALGLASNDGSPEVYAIVEIWRVD